MSTLSAQSSYSDVFAQDTPEFIEALRTTIFPGEIVDLNANHSLKRQRSDEDILVSKLSQEFALNSSQDTIPDDRQEPETPEHAAKRIKLIDDREFVQGSSKQVPASQAKKDGIRENIPVADSLPKEDVIFTTDPVTLEDAKRVPGYAPYKANVHAERLMQDPTFRAEHTSAAGADFIEGFYQNSRLHHLSTWKAELRALVAEAQERAELAFAQGGDVENVSNKRQSVGGEAEGDGFAGIVDEDTSPGTSMRGNAFRLRSPTKDKGKGKGRERNPGSDEMLIMHCDFDCFFPTVPLLSRPHLRDKPVVVCHSQGGQGGQASTSEISSANYKAREFGIQAGMRCAPHCSQRFMPLKLFSVYTRLASYALQLLLYHTNSRSTPTLLGVAAC